MDGNLLYFLYNLKTRQWMVLVMERIILLCMCQEDTQDRTHRESSMLTKTIFTTTTTTKTNHMRWNILVLFFFCVCFFSTISPRCLSTECWWRLVVLLHASRCHAVDDRVTSRVHVADGVANGDQGEEHGDSEPEQDVEDDRIVSVVLFGSVQIKGLFG